MFTYLYNRLQVLRQNPIALSIEIHSKSRHVVDVKPKSWKDVKVIRTLGTPFAHVRAGVPALAAGIDPHDENILVILVNPAMDDAILPAGVMLGLAYFLSASVKTKKLDTETNKQYHRRITDLAAEEYSADQTCNSETAYGQLAYAFTYTARNLGITPAHNVVYAYQKAGIPVPMEFLIGQYIF